MLSQHLNSHGIEWKIYWDMYLHHVSGLTCNLCRAAHADVYSLESHLKMTHCMKRSHEAPASSDVEQGSGSKRVPSGSNMSAAQLATRHRVSVRNQDTLQPEDVRDSFNRPAGSELDIIEVIDVESRHSRFPEHPVSPAAQLPDEQLSRPPRRHEAAAVSRPQKPTAVVSPYDSAREQPQQQSSSSTSSVFPAGGEPGLPAAGGSGTATLPDVRYRRGPGAAGDLWYMEVPTQQAFRAAFDSHPPSASPAVPAYSAEPPSQPPPAAPTEARPSGPNAVASNPLLADLLRSAGRRAGPAEPLWEAGRSQAPSAARPESPAPPLSPWLDPVYQPGTLTRLGEQAAALRLRHAGAERPPDDGAESVLRLRAAAESDQLTAGSSGGRPPGAAAAHTPHVSDLRQPALTGQQSGGVLQPPAGAASTAADTAGEPVGAPSSGGYWKDTLPPTIKTELVSPDKSTAVVSMAGVEEDSLGGMIKEEPIPVHPSTGIDVNHLLDKDPDGRVNVPADGTELVAMEVEMKAEVKAEESVDFWQDECMDPDGTDDAAMAGTLDVPASDPLAVSGDVKPTAVGFELGGRLSADAPQTDTEQLLEPVRPPPATPSRGRGGRRTRGGRKPAPQDAGSRRRRRKNNWCEKKKGRPLYSKPQG